jgi:N-acetylmuramidase
MALPALTTEHPNFRDVPSLQSDVIRILEPGTPCALLDPHGEYFRVKVDGQIGYVHRDYLVPDPSRGPIPDDPADAPPPPPAPPPGPVAVAPTALPDFLAAELPYFTAVLTPSKSLAGSSTVAAIWNQYGGLLDLLSNTLGVDSGIAVGALATESGGSGFGADGRLLIRFENQIFYDCWGKANDATFRDHFAFAPVHQWTEHRWRPTASEDWRQCHESQAVEWDVFTFARGLDETAAMMSISMGLTQVMGFNHATIGYPTVQDMFAAFCGNARYQIIAFFDFVRRNGGIPRLRNRDYAAFARMYNGEANVAVYEPRIRAFTQQFDTLMEA